MRMSNLYFLSKNNKMLATFIDNKALVITSSDRDKLHGFSTVLLEHKTKHNKWMNKGYKYLQNHKGMGTDIVELVEDNNLKVEEFKDIFMEICHLNMEDIEDSKFMNRLYELSRLHVFMMYDYQYIPEIPLLTIHGVMIEKERNEEIVDIADYLDTVVNLNMDDDVYL